MACSYTKMKCSTHSSTWKHVANLRSSAFPQIFYFIWPPKSHFIFSHSIFIREVFTGLEHILFFVGEISYVVAMKKQAALRAFPYCCYFHSVPQMQVEMFATITSFKTLRNSTSQSVLPGSCLIRELRNNRDCHPLCVVGSPSEHLPRNLKRSDL